MGGILGNVGNLSDVHEAGTVRESSWIKNQNELHDVYCKCISGGFFSFSVISKSIYDMLFVYLIQVNGYLSIYIYIFCSIFKKWKKYEEWIVMKIGL